MTWNANQSQQNGNGQQFQRRIPDPGKGRLRMVDKARARDASKAPDFRGLINCDGHLIEVSIWHNPAKQSQNGSGMMPESFSASVRTFDPNQQNQGQGQQQPVQQQMPYAPAPQPQYAPAPQYAQHPVGPQHQQGPPQQYPPQNGGYAPAPGYHPPQAQPQQAPVQPPRWGGGPGQTMQANAAQGGGIPKSEIPFSMDR